MYSVVIESSFSATHQLRLADGSHEPLHGHDWKVRALFSSEMLDDVGMVVDFEDARDRLESVIAPFRYANLSEHETFRGLNATAEVVARIVFDGLKSTGLDSIRRVEITEAPGCMAVYES